MKLHGHITTDDDVIATPSLLEDAFQYKGDDLRTAHSNESIGEMGC